MIDRESVLAALRAKLEPLPFVNAMWVGGSDAFGAADAHSDVDVMVDVEDEILRGHALDAFAFHKSFVVDPLVELVRMRHCPQWYDWGLRYLDRQLPPDLVARLKKLVFVRDLEELERARVEGTAWIERELATPLP